MAAMVIAEWMDSMIPREVKDPEDPGTLCSPPKILYNDIKTLCCLPLRPSAYHHLPQP